VLVPAFDLDNKPDNPLKIRTWKPKFFHNYPGEDSDAAEKVVDVALRTSAAPTYFPVYQGYIDGGIFATNPSVCALTQALHPQTGGQCLEDVILLSIGTGTNPMFLAEMDADWGLAQWAPHLVNLMLEGGAGMADYQCRQILDDRYFRIDPVLPVPIELDGVNQIPLMEDIAAQVDLTAALEWLDMHFQCGDPDKALRRFMESVPQEEKAKDKWRLSVVVLHENLRKANGGPREPARRAGFGSGAREHRGWRSQID
jgi:hypothetical protein